MKKLLLACLAFCATSHAMDNKKSEVFCRQFMCKKLLKKHDKAAKNTTPNNGTLLLFNPMEHDSLLGITQDRENIAIKKKKFETCMQDCIVIMKK